MWQSLTENDDYLCQMEKNNTDTPRMVHVVEHVDCGLEKSP